jgi:excisionase family DNA binding protein
VRVNTARNKELSAFENPPEPAVLTVEEAARMLRISRGSCYELIRQHQIPHIRLGRSIRVPRFGLEQWLARESGLPEPAPAAPSFRPQIH